MRSLSNTLSIVTITANSFSRLSYHASCRKAGEQTEVDWAGQTAAIIDRDSGEMIPAYIFVAVLSIANMLM